MEERELWHLHVVFKTFGGPHSSGIWMLEMLTFSFTWLQDVMTQHRWWWITFVFATIWECIENNFDLKQECTWWKGCTVVDYAWNCEPHFPSTVPWLGSHLWEHNSGSRCIHFLLIIEPPLMVVETSTTRGSHHNWLHNRVVTSQYCNQVLPPCRNCLRQRIPPNPCPSSVAWLHLLCLGFPTDIFLAIAPHLGVYSEGRVQLWQTGTSEHRTQCCCVLLFQDSSTFQSASNNWISWRVLSPNVVLGGSLMTQLVSCPIWHSSVESRVVQNLVDEVHWLWQINVSIWPAVDADAKESGQVTLHHFGQLCLLLQHINDLTDLHYVRTSQETVIGI